MLANIQVKLFEYSLIKNIVMTILKMTMARMVVEMAMLTEHSDDDDGQDDSGGADGISPSGTRV